MDIPWGKNSTPRGKGNVDTKLGGEECRGQNRSLEIEFVGVGGSVR